MTTCGGASGLRLGELSYPNPTLNHPNKQRSLAGDPEPQNIKTQVHFDFAQCRLSTRCARSG